MQGTIKKDQFVIWEMGDMYYSSIEPQSLKRQWKEEEPVEVRFGQQWCPATVVGVGKSLVDCKLLQEIKVVLGPKGFLGRKPNFVVYEKGEIVPKPANAQFIRKRVDNGPTDSAFSQGETVEMSTYGQDNVQPAHVELQSSSPQRWKPTLLEYCLLASLVLIFFIGYFTNVH